MYGADLDFYIYVPEQMCVLLVFFFFYNSSCFFGNTFKPILDICQLPMLAGLGCVIRALGSNWRGSSRAQGTVLDLHPPPPLLMHVIEWVYCPVSLVSLPPCFGCPFADMGCALHMCGQSLAL